MFDMTCFFFHVRTDTVKITDPEGSFLPDLAAARDAALEWARHMWATAIVEQRDLSSHRFEITDERGAALLTVWFHEALPGCLQPAPSTA